MGNEASIRAHMIRALRRSEDLNLGEGWQDLHGVLIPPQITLEEWQRRQDTILQQPVELTQ